MAISRPKLSLGPVLYYWSREKLFEFYESIAKTDVDIVYLGETVCSKRRSLNYDDWIEIATLLKAAGKEVVLSTLALIEASSELSLLHRICNEHRFSVEANDMAAVNLLSRKTFFVAGPSINIYNTHSLDVLAPQGLKRWVMPVELSRTALADIQQQRPDNVETEVFAYGRLPLAYSARCFTARAHDLAKDDCQFCCQEDPDGLLLSTREAMPFLVLNGIQTQSARTCNLINELDDLIKLKLDVLRISPQAQHTEKVIDIFADCIHRNKALTDASDLLETLMPVGSCNGYWYGEAGMDHNSDHIQDMNLAINQVRHV